MENKVDKRKLRVLIAQSESEILEYKGNNTDPDRIGKYASALANSAAMLSKQFAYMVWRISDEKEIIGTTFTLNQRKKAENRLFLGWKEC